MNIFKHILLTLALTPIAVAQYQYPDEITEPKGMQDIMAEIVSGKYRMKQALLPGLMRSLPRVLTLKHSLKMNFVSQKTLMLSL